MAGRGPNPKSRRVRDRDSATVIELFSSTGKRHGKPLPRGVLPDGEQWCEQTVAWWNAIRSWPLMENEPEVSWQFMVDTAMLHHTMWSRGRLELAAEIRLRVAKFGATREDRDRLRVSVRTPADETSSELSGVGTEDQSWREERRRRLTGRQPETPQA